MKFMVLTQLGSEIKKIESLRDLLDIQIIFYHFSDRLSLYL